MTGFLPLSPEHGYDNLYISIFCLYVLSTQNPPKNTLAKHVYILSKPIYTKTLTSYTLAKLFCSTFLTAYIKSLTSYAAAFSDYKAAKGSGIIAKHIYTKFHLAYKATIFLYLAAKAPCNKAKAKHRKLFTT